MVVCTKVRMDPGQNDFLQMVNLNIEVNEIQDYIEVFGLNSVLVGVHYNEVDIRNRMVDFGRVLVSSKSVDSVNVVLVNNKIKNLSNFESESSSTKSKNGWSIKKRNSDKFIHINIDFRDSSKL